MAKDLSALKTLFQTDKALAKECLEGIARAARQVVEMIEAEMLKRFGFKWDVWCGFHAVQSME